MSGTLSGGAMQMHSRAQGESQEVLGCSPFVHSRYQTEVGFISAIF